MPSAVDFPTGNARQCRLPRWQVNAVLVSEILRDHRAVKGHKAGRIGKAGEQRGDVAVSDKDFGMASDLRRIKFPQQIICPIPTASTHNGADLLASEHLLEFTGSAFRGPGKIQILLKNGR
jgi:hypothetical protein